MSRKIISAALALTVAGGVYLAAPSVEASNMGFKLERSFDLTRDTVTGRPYLNLYLVSFPLFNGLADIANVNHPGSNKCVGDPGGPAAGDGWRDANDALCDFWLSRQGTMIFQKFDRDTCSYQARTATLTPLGGVQFSGTFTGPAANNLIDNASGREIGYQVLVSVPAGSPLNPTNRAVIVGSHDPSFTGRPIIAAPAITCAPNAAHLDIVNLPYHTMYQRANEMLCGLEGVDWVDVATPIGDPDTCPNGTDPANAGIPFDGLRSLQVQTYDNEVDHGYVVRTVTYVPLTRQVSFSGRNFALRPGDAYIFGINPAHAPTTFLSPHF